MMLAAAALQWYIDNGIDEVLGDAPVDRFQPPPPAPVQEPASFSEAAAQSLQTADIILGANDAQLEAIKQANAATTLAELQEAIQTFDGMEIKKNATNIVFSSGNPNAKIMLIGDVPSADDDRAGEAFQGASGQLLDRILAAIQQSRAESVYLTNILNWRPPGNRTPTPAEIAISLPFIERHIALINPDIIILCGAVAAKTLTGKTEGISRLRKSKHSYNTRTNELKSPLADITAIATYHPTTLLTTPLHKKAVWADMLKIQQLISNTGQT